MHNLSLLFTRQEFLVYEYLLAIADWDRKHKATYGTLKKTNKEIAKGVNWTESPISRYKNRLIKKGFLIERSDGWIEIPLFWMTEPTKAFKLKKGDHAELQEEHADLQEAIAFMQGDFAFLQERESKKQASVETTSDIKCQYKSEYFAKKKKILIKQEARSDEEYQEIYKEGGYKGFTPDYMKWVDENVVEEVELKEDKSLKETEKDIIDVFFKGNYDRYKKAVSRGGEEK